MIERWGRDTARRVFGESLAAVRNVRELIRDGEIACDAMEAGHLKIAHRPMSAEEKQASAFCTDHVLTDTRNLLYYWRRLPDERILFGGRGSITDSPAGSVRQREFLLSELKAKLPALKDITVDYDWCGWVCLTADFLPHVYHAEDDLSAHYAIGYQGSGVAYGLYAGRLLARRVAGEKLAQPIPSTSTSLPRFPLAALRRAGQRATYLWYRYLDARD